MLPAFRRCLTVPACLWLAVAGASAEEEAAPSDVPTEQDLEEVSAEWKAVWEKSRSAEDAREYGNALQGLGLIERAAGKPAEAVTHLQEAVERLATAEPAARADVLEALALSRQDLGEVEAAEELLRQVLAARGALPAGEREAPLAQARDHLALNLLIQGHYPEAGELLNQALDATPENDPATRARRLGYLARYLHTLGSYARAAAACEEALKLEFDDKELTLTLTSQLALAQLRLGRVDEARSGLEACADQASELYQDPALAFRAEPYTNNLGVLDLSQGNALDAANIFAKSLRILEEARGPEDAVLIRPLNNLGCAEQAAGDYKRAGEHLRRAAELQAKHLPRVHLRVAETARNLARNSLLSGDSDALPEIDRATSIGLELLDEMIHHGSEQERLNFLQRLDLVSLPCATGDAERIARVLAASKARLLDAMLEEEETENATPAPAPSWQEIRKTLQPGCAFVDACRYLSAGPEAEMRYGAVVMLPEGPPKWVELGSAADLDRWLENFRRRLDWRAGELAGKSSPAPTLTLRSILRSLHDEFWEPIAKELPAGTQHVAFSPDGALHFLPLATLLDESMQPLCKRYLQVVTVTSARDLAGPASPLSLRSSPWTVFGVSEFPKSKEDPGEDRLLRLLANLDSMPGTADETQRLLKLAPQGSVFLRDGGATETALAHLSPPPAVLHLGSHAFFLPGRLPAGELMDFDENADLLYSGGLLLHGAALRKPNSPMLSETDDVLFPSEVAKLPLHGTRLVTLSSCESGAGTAVSGEGLLGLRRGFALAGAREIVVALWPVSDRSTPEFMERFYRLALASDRPGQALWQCQREFLEGQKDDAEFEAAVLRYGPFVLSQNTPLETGGLIVVKTTGFPWRRLWIASPLLVFLVARLWGKRAKKALDPAPAG